MPVSTSKRKQRSRQRTPFTSLLPPGQLLLVLAAVAVVLVGGVLWLASRANPASDFVPEVSGAPRVAVAQEVVNYGDVRLNTPLEAVFRVRNVGDQPLYIQGEPQVELVQGC